MARPLCGESTALAGNRGRDGIWFTVPYLPSRDRNSPVHPHFSPVSPIHRLVHGDTKTAPRPSSRADMELWATEHPQPGGNSRRLAKLSRFQVVAARERVNAVQTAFFKPARPQNLTIVPSQLACALQQADGPTPMLRPALRPRQERRSSDRRAGSEKPPRHLVRHWARRQHVRDAPTHRHTGRTNPPA